MSPLYTNLYNLMRHWYRFKPQIFNQPEWKDVSYANRDCIASHKIGQLVEAYTPSTSIYSARYFNLSSS